MSDEKKPLQNNEMSGVAGGYHYYDPNKEDTRYEPYTDTMITITCPKCGRKDKIWYRPFFGIEELEDFWCRNCGWKFGRDEMDYCGSNGDW